MTASLSGSTRRREPAFRSQVGLIAPLILSILQMERNCLLKSRPRITIARTQSLLWKGTRGVKDAPSGWDGVNPDKSLAAAVSHCVAKKSETTRSSGGYQVIPLKELSREYVD